MISVAIVDDEPLAQEVLITYLKKHSGFSLSGVCRNALEAFALINSQQVDLLLLDINMPGVSGLDFLRSLKHPPKVIFTTAYPNHAVDSYDLNAVDYLLKPISPDRFAKALQKVEQQLTAVKQTPEAITPESSMLVRSDGKWIRVVLNQLLFVEGLKDYVRLWINNDRITVHSTLKNMEAQLTVHTNFKRIHKSYIVNTDKVDQITGNTVHIKSQELPVGNTYRDELADLILRLKQKH